MRADEVAKVWKYLTEDEKNELITLVDGDSAVWRPQPGPQADAFYCEADVTGFGGSAGGGKSDLISGLSLTEHKRIAIFRREKAQTERIVQRLGELLGGTVGLNSQKGIWQLGGGHIIEFAGLDNPTDHTRWQGRDHDLKCVAADTMIWMADGSMAPVQHVRVGDMVYTLDGPRPVTRTMTVRKEAVTLTGEGWSQTQSIDHAVLASPCRCGSASPKECRCAPQSERTCEWTSPFERRLPEALFAGQPTSVGSCPDEGSRQPWSGVSAGTADTRRETEGEGSRERRPVDGLPPLSSPLRVVLLQPLHDQTECVACWQRLGHGALDVAPSSSPQGSLARCSSESRRDGEPLPPSEGDVQQCPLQLADAGPQNPTCSLADERRQTPTRSRHTWSWAHPYRSETHQTVRPARIASCSVEYIGARTLYDLTVDDANHYVAGAGVVNRNCYDEVTEMREAQVRYTMGWNRSADPKVRSRVLMTFNPPTTAEGRWVIAYFAPWLDPRHPNPAKPGEIRWFTTIQEKDVEVPDNRPFVLVGERRIYAFDPEDHRPEEIIKPKSRTFIPSRVTDNPYYMATDYISTLQAMPEPLRSQMLKGDFQAGVRDDEMQVIPTAWIDAAMNRWEPRPNGKGEMDSIGSDPARGGPDVHVISRRHGTWFDELVLHPGKETPDGPTGAAQILQERRDEAPIHIDIIGWGAAVFDALVANNLQTIGVNAASKSYQVAKEGGLKFANMRAEMVWQMREALSPTNPIQISLPKDPILAADLAAYKWKFTIKGIQIRDKAEMKVQLGRSPDRGDAVCLANRATVKTRQFEAFTAEKPYNSYDDLER